MENNLEKSEKIEKSSSIRGLEYEFVPGAQTMGAQKVLFSQNKNATIETLYQTVEHSPEVTACICALVEDIMGDGWRFTTIIKKGKSQDALNTAVEFQEKSKFFRVLTNALVDLFITGNAYILKLSVDEKKIKEVIEILTKRIGKHLNVKMDKRLRMNKDVIFELVQQDLGKQPVKDLQLIKSSTVTINFDETGKIASYEQRVQGKVRVFDAKDVIHLSTMNIGGQPYGFTPLETLLSDIATLIFAKEYAGKYFENDGIPSFMFLMPNEHPKSPNYENLKSELKELKKQANKFRSLVLTGQVDYKEIQKFNKDMEFSKLIQHFTQIVLMAMGVPAHRVNLTIDVRQIGGAVNRAYEGYYKKIGFTQLGLAEDLNRELWVPFFKVRMSFKESYKIDEMREAQIIQILTQVGAITVEEAREMIGLDPEKPKGTEPNKTSPVFGGVATDINQRAQTQDASKIPEVIDNRLKSGIPDAIEVDYVNFVKTVEGRVGAGKFDMANLLYIENVDGLILFFDDGNWKYKTKIPNNSVKLLTGSNTIEQYKIERLHNAIKIFM